LYIHKEPQILPGILGTDWGELTILLSDDDELSDADHELELGKAFSGILPIGSQGCSSLHGLNY